MKCLGHATREKKFAGAALAFAWHGFVFVSGSRRGVRGVKGKKAEPTDR